VKRLFILTDVIALLVLFFIKQLKDKTMLSNPPRRLDPLDDDDSILSKHSKRSRGSTDKEDKDVYVIDVIVNTDVFERANEDETIKSLVRKSPLKLFQ
jgi:hypothetical protein